jgi:hypothetical protein
MGTLGHDTPGRVWNDHGHRAYGYYAALEDVLTVLDGEDPRNYHHIFIHHVDMGAVSAYQEKQQEEKRGKLKGLRQLKWIR